MIAAIYTLFIVNCFFLCLIVLMQSGKGGGMELMGGGGGGGSATVFGNRGATTFVHKLTIGSAALFMFLSMLLAYLSTTPTAVDPSSFRQAAPVAPAQGAGDGLPGLELDLPGAGGDEEGFIPIEVPSTVPGTEPAEESGAE